MLGVLHTRTSGWMNRLDKTPGRKAWNNFRDMKLLTRNRYLPRLNYVRVALQKRRSGARCFLRGFAISLGILSQPRTWAIAAPPRLNVDFVVDTPLFIETLEVRQQGGLRELHRLWCWPQRSSHGQDQLGYRPCTLTRGPAPKSTQPCFISQPSSSYVFLRKWRGEVLKKI
jgi:hypothetical protein